MFCPKCGQQQFCCCSNCISTVPEGQPVEKWITPDGPVACGKCGFARSQEWWFDLNWDIAEDDTKDKEEFEFIKEQTNDAEFECVHCGHTKNCHIFEPKYELQGFCGKGRCTCKSFEL